MADDILADCMGRLLKAGIPADVVIRTISAVRRDWGGVSEYVAKIDRQARDKAIADALTAGLPLPEIAAKVQCSVRTIRRRKSEFTI
jgi:DNA-binding NarL/FixJ family response regulator